MKNMKNKEKTKKNKENKDLTDVILVSEDHDGPADHNKWDDHQSVTSQSRDFPVSRLLPIF